MDERCVEEMREGYGFDQPALRLGAPIKVGEVAAMTPVRMPLPW